MTRSGKTLGRLAEALTSASLPLKRAIHRLLGQKRAAAVRRRLVALGMMPEQASHGRTGSRISRFSHNLLPRNFGTELTTLLAAPIDARSRSQRTAAGMPSLRIGSIVSPALAARLAPDAELAGLPEHDLSSFLDSSHVDLVLVETTETGERCDWIGLPHLDEPIERLKGVVEMAGARGIPAVLWASCDPLLASDYFRIAESFAEITCTSHAAADVFRKRFPQKSVTAVPLCHQPALHNPLRRPSLDLRSRCGILVHGLAELARFPDQFQILNDLKEFDVTVVDTRFSVVDSKRKEMAGEWKPARILGTVTHEQFASLMKLHRVLLIPSRSLSLPGELAKLAVEALASELPVVSMLDFPCDPQLSPHIKFCKSDHEAVDAVREALANPTMPTSARELRSQVCPGQTYRNAINRSLQLANPQKNIPNLKATVVAVTNRPHLVSRCIDTFYAFDYSHKELILIVNSRAARDEINAEAISREPSITLRFVDEEYNIGACLNMGVRLSTGDFVFKMDDDDYYSRSYLTEMIYSFEASQADVMGRVPRYYYFESDKGLYAREIDVTKFNLIIDEPVPRELMGWATGATIAARRTAARASPFNQNFRGSVDAMFYEDAINNPNLRFALIDGESFIAARSADTDLHTWRIEDDRLKRTLVYMGDERTLMKLIDRSDGLIHPYWRAAE